MRPSQRTTPESEPDGSADLARRLVDAARLRHPRLHLGIVVALGVLVAVCLLATITRMSALPLLPLAPLTVAAYCAWRARSSGNDRQLVRWTVLLAMTVAASFWLVAVVGRMFG
jgi:hypothetical protein